MSERMESMLGADREDNAEAHFAAVHSHRHLFSIPENVIVRPAVRQSFAISAYAASSS